MTIEELYNANKNMGIYAICVIHCSYDYAERRPIDDIQNGCIIYQDEYYTMPKVLKSLQVLNFRRSNEEFNKWEIWVE